MPAPRRVWSSLRAGHMISVRVLGVTPRGAVGEIQVGLVKRVSRGRGAVWRARPQIGATRAEGAPSTTCVNQTPWREAGGVPAWGKTHPTSVWMKPAKSEPKS